MSRESAVVYRTERRGRRSPVADAQQGSNQGTISRMADADGPTYGFGDEGFNHRETADGRCTEEDGKGQRR
jgi:hypothetical protein